MNEEERQKNHALAEKLISEERFAAAMVAGAVAALLAAAAYGIAVSVWPLSYGFAAAGVGLFVGLAIGFLGRGVSSRFAVLAAIFTFVGCVVGNAVAQVFHIARATGTSPLDVMTTESLSTLFDWLVSGLSLVHAVYWLVAVVCAGFLSRRALSRADRLALGMYRVKG